MRCDIFGNNVINRRFSTPNKNLTRSGFSIANKNIVARSGSATPNKNMVAKSATPNRSMLARSATPNRNVTARSASLTPNRSVNPTPNRNLTPFKNLRFDNDIDVTAGYGSIGSGFCIEGILGSGGFGSVFLGRYAGAKVAIKCLNKCTKNIIASRQVGG